MGGIVEDLVKGAIEPTVDAIASGAREVWARRAETDSQELEILKAQLEAAKWPDFDEAK